MFGKNTAAYFNDGKSAPSFCRQAAAWFPAMFCSFYFMKIHKIAKSSTTIKAREKINTDLASSGF
jgi:hypothetical protein